MPEGDNNQVTPDANKTESLNDENKHLKDENSRLNEELELQKTNWLYSHNLIIAIILGVLLTFIVPLITFTSEYALNLQSFYRGYLEYVLFGLIIFIAPAIPIFLMPMLLKAPLLSFRFSRIYIVSYLVFASIFFAIDPFNRFLVGIAEGSRIPTAISFAGLSGTVAVFAFYLVPVISRRIGYRLVLKGSAVAFTIKAGVEDVSKQLREIKDDFNLSLVEMKKGEECNNKNQSITPFSCTLTFSIGKY